MKIKIVEGGKMGYPARLNGKTVDVEKIGNNPDVYRPVERENNYLRVTQRQIERGEAEMVEDTFDYVTAYARAFGGFGAPPPVVEDDDEFDITGVV